MSKTDLEEVLASMEPAQAEKTRTQIDEILTQMLEAQPGISLLVQNIKEQRMRKVQIVEIQIQQKLSFLFVRKDYIKDLPTLWGFLERLQNTFKKENIPFIVDGVLDRVDLAKPLNLKEPAGKIIKQYNFDGKNYAVCLNGDKIKVFIQKTNGDWEQIEKNKYMA